MNRLTAYIRRHHVGLLALIIAMSGTAVAATKLGPNDIAKNAIRGYHVKNGQIGVKDLRKVKSTAQVTKTVPRAASAGQWSVGLVRAECPKGSLAIGIRTDWLSGAQPLALHKFSMRGRSAVVTGINGSTSTDAELAVLADCLPLGK